LAHDQPEAQTERHAGAGPLSATSGSLPARDFEEIRLAEALERGRCPVCDARQEASWAALRGLAREGATDRGLRDRMDRGLGFCQVHSIGLSKMELLQTSSQLATAVLLDAVLRRRLAALKKLSGSDAAGQGRGLQELVEPRCPVCERIAEASHAAVERLLGLAADAAWSSALSGAEICLEDLYALWSVAAAGPRELQARWSPVLAGQLKRLEALQKTLAEYAHNSTSDRRHLITPEQHAAGAAAIRFFGGTPDRDRQR
jgi:hypothetical protein